MLAARMGPRKCWMRSVMTPPPIEATPLLMRRVASITPTPIVPMPRDSIMKGSSTKKPREYTCCIVWAAMRAQATKRSLWPRWDRGFS